MSQNSFKSDDKPKAHAQPKPHKVVAHKPAHKADAVDVVGLTAAELTQQPASKYRWSRLLMYPAWVLTAFIASQFIIVALIWVLKFLHSPLLTTVNETVMQLVLAVLVYTLSLSIAFGVPWLVRRHKVSLSLLGLTRLPSWTDIGLAPLGFLAYALILSGLMYVVTLILPSFPINEAQDVGFRSMGTHFEYLIGFIALVVLAPIAEEVLFRGYLYGRLRVNVPRWAAILVVSALFAAVHGQWNVMVDTFVLSIILCLLRELTGSLWASILLHMIKNGVAFYLLYVAQIMSM